MTMKKFVKSMTAGILAAVMVFTSAFAGSGNVLTADAASVYESENLLVNPDFEDSKAFSPAGGSHVGNWFFWQKAAKTSEDAYSGSTSVKFTASDAALEQDLNGSTLIPGMTYVYTIWARLSGNTNAEHIIGVKNYGGSELKQQVNSTEWKKYEVEFVYTSGNPRVYGYVGSHAGVDMYIDNASVTAKTDIESVSIENGTLTVDFVDSYVGMPSITDVSATYSVEPGNLSGTVQFYDAEWEPTDKIATIYFTEIPAAAVEQVVTVNLTYENVSISLDYTVAANGEAVVTANLVSVDAENGKITATLDKVPTVAPEAEDFVWEYKVNDGEYEALTVDNFAYDKETSKVTVTFDEFRSVAECAVSVKVTYAEASLEDSFVVEASDAATYYVDATNGNDNNNGLSEDQAFASIDKLNTITFLPGDQILFKKGETFVGCFKPQGSGTETAPITIGAYGEGDERPVLQPGADWTVSHVMSANAIVHNAKVNYVLQFYNVEFWEVSDLEIFDPNSEAYLTRGSGKYIGNSANDVYRSGITIQAEDIGVLEHIYVDNVIIHGFHGPGTNIGKTSGGITMNVITNSARNRALSVPTQINDIRITNCEIYDVGRSGINFLTPWSFRTDAKWGPFNYGTRGYEYLPYEDFYMGNNYIHDVDGDGTIVDNCSGAVSEYNLVTRCCLRPATEGGGAAVGLFNWNSDDTYFQFNEVYDIREGSGATASNDSQGIEIDALNDRTWVQYNYVHDNKGGFMMLCNVGDNYRSFDGIIRYNISQDDYTHPRQGIFDIYSANYGTEVYNNTFYFTDRAVSQNGYQSYVKPGELFLFSAAAAYDTMKFYNNIFYYDGETPVTANKFGDSAIDWQSNIFCGFANLPKDDNPDAPNMSVDPMLVNIGKGGTGTTPGEMPDLSCYYTTEGSPAINAGVPVANNGGRDFFGNEVAGIPDIGAYESGSVVLKAASVNEDVTVSNTEETISMLETLELTVEELLDAIVVDTGVTVEVTRNGKKLANNAAVKENDVLTISDGTDAISFKVVLVADPDKRVIPVEYLVATAGDEHKGVAAEGPAANVLDDNMSTLWHTDWYGTSRANHWIQLEVTEDYVVDTLRYMPRTSGTNGTITQYEIKVSNDGSEWTTVAAGEWDADASMKVVSFEPQQAKYVRLVAVNADGPAGQYVFASAAEMRLLGDKVVDEPVKEEVCEVFTDIEHGAWYEGAVQYVYDNGIIVGDGNTFSPDLITTRAMVSMILYRLAGEPEVTDFSEYNKFTDLPATHEWYSKAVAWALNEGVATGDNYNMLYNPNALVTREQLAVLLCRYAEYTGKDVTVSSAYDELFGGTYVSEWAKAGFAWAIENEIIKGSEATDASGNVYYELNPQGGATRAQLATVFQRFCEN